MNDIIQQAPEQPSQNDCNLSMLAHLLGIVTFIFGALIIWLIKKDESSFVGDNAREALNFQITVMLGFIVAKILIWVLIGFALLPLIYIGNIVFCIVGAVAASKGQRYRYPLAFRFLS